MEILRPSMNDISSSQSLKKIKSTKRHDLKEIEYSVDIKDLLFTDERDFLIRNNDEKVRIDDLKGKTIVLYIVPIYKSYLNSRDDFDMLEAYNEILPFGDVEFVFVPVLIDRITQTCGCDSKEAAFNHMFKKLPWPAVPLYDVEACGNRVVETFSVDHHNLRYSLPYWVIIDPKSTVLATQFSRGGLFSLFGGAELHPFSSHHLSALWDEYNQPLISMWDKLLVYPGGRDYLLSSNGHKVNAVSSLRGKVIGFFFCQNKPFPEDLEPLRKAYQEAKERCLDFEVVQINIHYDFLPSEYNLPEDVVSALQPYEDVPWLILPFKDPRCRKLNHLFRLTRELDYNWKGCCLVIVDARSSASAQQQLAFEFSGVEIIQHYGIEGYPFIRKHLFEKEYNMQKQNLNFQSLFPPTECVFELLPGHPLDLLGKRVIVVFYPRISIMSKYKASDFLRMLKSVKDGGKDKFEVVCIPTDHPTESLDTESIQSGMLRLVHDSESDFARKCCCKIFPARLNIGAAAFDRDGKLIAKENLYGWDKREHPIKPEFPFVNQDLKRSACNEVCVMCELDLYYEDESQL